MMLKINAKMSTTHEHFVWVNVVCKEKCMQGIEVSELVNITNQNRQISVASCVYIYLI